MRLELFKKLAVLDMPGVDMKDVRALQLDHRNNDGAEERRLYGRQSYSIMTYMKLTGDPEVRKKFHWIAPPLSFCEHKYDIMRSFTCSSLKYRCRLCSLTN